MFRTRGHGSLLDGKATAKAIKHGSDPMSAGEPIPAPRLPFVSSRPDEESRFHRGVPALRFSGPVLGIMTVVTGGGVARKAFAAALASSEPVILVSPDSVAPSRRPAANYPGMAREQQEARKCVFRPAERRGYGLTAVLWERFPLPTCSGSYKEVEGNKSSVISPPNGKQVARGAGVRARIGGIAGASPRSLPPLLRRTGG